MVILLEFFYRRTVRSQREREWWTLLRPAALRPGMSVPHRDLFSCQSVGRVCDILVRIRIRGSVPLTNGSRSGSWRPKTCESGLPTLIRATVKFPFLKTVCRKRSGQVTKHKGQTFVASSVFSFFSSFGS
jgi:hypothetical protein